MVIERIAGASPRSKARIAGGFYLLNIVTGGLAAALVGPSLVGYADAAILAATACYVAVTLLFYQLFKVVSRWLALLAAFFSLVGCATGILSLLHLAPFGINNLVFFGAYCVLIGNLILRSTFLPRFLGVLMVLAGLGWLTFLLPQLANHLTPFNLLPGIVGEGSLTVWLLVVGLNEDRWAQQADTAGTSIRT